VVVDNVIEKHVITVDRRWSGRLWALQRRAIYCQHQLAYLSTLGGAHHVCKHPDIALKLALRTEAIGRYLGAPDVIVRARVHQVFQIFCLMASLFPSRKPRVAAYKTKTKTQDEHQAQDQDRLYFLFSLVLFLLGTPCLLFYEGLELVRSWKCGGGATAFVTNKIAGRRIP
jgi:hypothetical protein